MAVYHNILRLFKAISLFSQYIVVYLRKIKAKGMFKILSIPDRFKVSKEEWQEYIRRIIDKKPTEKQRIAYELFNKKIEDAKNI